MTYFSGGKTVTVIDFILKHCYFLLSKRTLNMSIYVHTHTLLSKRSSIRDVECTNRLYAHFALSYLTKQIWQLNISLRIYLNVLTSSGFLVWAAGIVIFLDQKIKKWNLGKIVIKGKTKDSALVWEQLCSVYSCFAFLIINCFQHL